jgi:tyrosyl-tRNA synthetase
MWRYFDLVSGMSKSDIDELKQQVIAGANPRDIKIILAKAIVGRFHDQSDVETAHQAFIDQFSKQQIPTDIPVYELSNDDLSKPLSVLLRDAGLVSSSSEANRLIKQNAIKFEGVAITHLPTFESECILQVGKRRFVKFIVSV